VDNFSFFIAHFFCAILARCYKYMIKAVESFLKGHPDKICDQIADAIVDEYLRRDPTSSLDIKVLGSHGMIMVGGEVCSRADFDVSAIVLQVYQSIGFTDEVEIFVNIESQSKFSSEIRRNETVVVNGYATKETRELLPKALVYVHDLARHLDELRQTDPSLSWLGPDGKVQLIMEGTQVTHTTILIQHPSTVSVAQLQSTLFHKYFPSFLKESKSIFFLNPLGPFTKGGIVSWGGASGRAGAIDFYGDLIPHGNVVLCGKDPTRPERAGAYMTRFIARELVNQGLVDAVMISFVYGDLVSCPLAIDIRPLGLIKTKTKEDLLHFIKKTYDLRPEAIAEFLDLKKPIYQATSVYGQFGREGFPWEEQMA
jgi:S-adenosylmethionine synthetase